MRKTDTVSRFGGDEFVIALPNTIYEQAVQFAQRLQERFRAELDRFEVQGAAVTASIGVTTMLPEDCSYEAVLKRADRGLYEAKGMGKDRVVAVTNACVGA
jgi:two-component system cell cycle response regulator